MTARPVSGWKALTPIAIGHMFGYVMRVKKGESGNPK